MDTNYSLNQSLFFLIKWCCVVSTGFDTGTPVFVQKGKDLLLNVTAPVTIVKRSEFRWRFYDSNIFRLFDDNETIIIAPYDGRVEIFLQNHSLLLKNVQQADSGPYRAVVSGDQIDDVGTYIVTVQGRFLQILNIDTQQLPNF